MWSAVILVCALAGPCDRAHAIASAALPEPAASLGACALQAQAFAAASPLLAARAGERIVVKCTAGARPPAARLGKP